MVAKKLSRREKINKLVEEVDDWELDTLLDFARGHLRQLLEKASDEEVDKCFNEATDKED